MNEFENYLQEKVRILRSRREEENQQDVSENVLYQLVLMEITYGELFVILKNFPDLGISEVNPIIERCLYVEARSKGLSAENALEETKKQMEDRSKK